MKPCKKSYSELMAIDSYVGRYLYLQTTADVGGETFGWSRHLNQALYASKKWKEFRNKVILRDNGCDMGHPDHSIGGPITIHHINPLTVEDVLKRDPKIFDLENVICVSSNTHKAIHYGDESMLDIGIIERTKGDTCPWKGG